MSGKFFIAAVPGLLCAARDIGSLADNLIAQGVAAEHLARVMTALNDGVSRRVLRTRGIREIATPGLPAPTER